MNPLRSRRGNIALGLTAALEAGAAAAMILTFIIQEWGTLSLTSALVIGLLFATLLIALWLVTMATKGLALPRPQRSAVIQSAPDRLGSSPGDASSAT